MMRRLIHLRLFCWFLVASGEVALTRRHNVNCLLQISTPSPFTNFNHQSCALFLSVYIILYLFLTWNQQWNGPSDMHRRWHGRWKMRWWHGRHGWWNAKGGSHWCHRRRQRHMWTRCHVPVRKRISRQGNTWHNGHAHILRHAVQIQKSEPKVSISVIMVALKLNQTHE